MKINFFTLIRQNIFLFIIINFVILIFFALFFYQIKSGKKYTYEMNINIHEYLKESTNNESFQFFHNYYPNVQFFNIVRNYKINNVALQITMDRHQNRILYEFITYDDLITKNEIFNYLKDILNKSIIKFNEYLIKKIDERIIFLEKKIDRHLLGIKIGNTKILDGNLFIKNFSEIENIEDFNSYIEKIEDFSSIVIYPNMSSELFYNKEMLLKYINYKNMFLDKSNLEINNDNLFTSYKFPKLNKQNLNVEPIFFKKFEYFYFVLVLQFSIIFSFILILLLNIKKNN